MDDPIGYGFDANADGHTVRTHAGDVDVDRLVAAFECDALVLVAGENKHGRVLSANGINPRRLIHEAMQQLATAWTTELFQRFEQFCTAVASA